MMLLHRPRGSLSVGRDELFKRADEFAPGHWMELIMSARIFPQDGDEESDEAVQQGSRTSMCSVAVRPFNEGRHRLRGAVIRALTDANPTATVLSVDGIGAYDHVFRGAMLSKLLSEPALHGLLPFVRAMYSSHHTTLGGMIQATCTTSCSVREGNRGIL